MTKKMISADAKDLDERVTDMSCTAAIVKV